MTEAQIKCFMTVAEEMSFSRAAQRLYRTQSAVSKNISSLERELGFMLFDRTGKQIKLTDEGELFLRFLSNAQEQYHRTMEEISALRTTHSGTIKIGIVDTWSTTQFYDEIFAHFMSVYPNIQIQVSAFGVDEMLSALRRGEIDIGITYDFMLDGQKDFLSKPFTDLEVGLLYADDGTGEKKSLSDFQNMFFLLKVEGTEHIRKLLTDLCLANGFAPRFLNSKGAGDEITEVRHNNGVLFCSAWHFWKESGLFRYFPLGFSIPTRLVFLQNENNRVRSLFINEVEMLSSTEENTSEGKNEFNG